MIDSTFTVHQKGASIKDAAVAALLFHGRGASAESILSLADDFQQPECTFLAIQAPGYSWYPNSFLAPIQSNEPQLSHALGAIRSLIDKLAGEGLARDRIVLMGFSQGACLALEYAARNAVRYGGVVAFSGGLIGSGPATQSGLGNPSSSGNSTSPNDKSFDYTGQMEGSPVFLGCSDIDPHIPAQRVHVSANVFRELGADVDKRIYPGMGHTINEEEMDVARRLIERVRLGN